LYRFAKHAEVQLLYKQYKDTKLHCMKELMLPGMHSAGVLE